MKVLFVSSGNSPSGISPIVKSQGESLKSAGLDIEYFTIKGKGLINYIKNIPKLRNYIKRDEFQIIHAHYSFSGFVCSLATKKPIVVSLMGSDVHQNRFWERIIRIFNHFSWNKLIVKSEEIKDKLRIKEANVVPNGVNIDRFLHTQKDKACELVNFDKSKNNIIWVSDPERYEKNFELAESAIEILDNPDVMLKTVNNILFEQVPIYMCAADILLITSLWEGSPNVIKEAMSCNLPIVTTNIGDVMWILGDTEGCFITSYDPADVAEKIDHAMEFIRVKGRTKGRERILQLGLDSEAVAKRIIKIYEKALIRE